MTALSLLVPGTTECTFSSPLVIEGVDMEDYTVEAVSCACSVALFNMALASHRSYSGSDVPERMQGKGLDQARSLYMQAYEISKNLDIPLLHIALCNNLLELSFEYGDVEAMSFWKTAFHTCMERFEHTDAPADVFVHLQKVHLFFTPDLHSARAA